MKKIPCGNPTCSERRQHWAIQEENRQHRMLEVADDFIGKDFCSISCACLAGYFDIKKGWIKDPKVE